MRWLLLAMGMACTHTGAAAPPHGVQDAFWPYWGDGQAEVAGYRLVQPRYGELRVGEAVYITVTEDLSHATRVKTEDRTRADRFAVLKLNAVRDFQTGMYDYNAMTSVFLPLDSALPLALPTKVSLGVQEWCGHVYEQQLVHGRTLRGELHSYFEGEGDAAYELALPKNALLADALPLAVRGLVGELVAPGEEAQVTLLATALDRRLRHLDPVWTPATIRRSHPAPVEVPAGAFEAWRYDVIVDGETDSSWQVEAAWPHRLLAWSRPDGEQGELTGSVRVPYWSRQAAGDEALRAQLGLPVPTPRP